MYRATKGNPYLAGVGGLIRNSRERWLGSFIQNVGMVSAIMTKLWAIESGLKLELNLLWKRTLKTFAL